MPQRHPIWRKIREQQGYPGTYQNVIRITRYLKEQEISGKPMPDSSLGISASQAARVLVKRSENRSDEESKAIRRLKKLRRTTERCCSLFE